MSSPLSEYSSDYPSKNLSPLIEIIRDQTGHSIEQRTVAILKLGELLQIEARELDAAKGIFCLIEQIQQDGSIRVMMSCIHALSHLQAVSSVRILLDVCLGGKITLYEGKNLPEFLNTDEVIRLRTLAVQVLGRLKDERAILPLLRIMNSRHENYRIRLACAEALGRLGDAKALNSLLDILSDDRERSLYLKESAVKALGMLGDIRALEPLIQMLESQRDIREKFDFLKEQIIAAIARILGRSHDQGRAHWASDILVNALQDEATSIRQAAVEALAEIGDGSNIPVLKEVIFDKEDSVALAAVSAIFVLGGESAILDLLSLENLPQFLRHELETYLP